MGEDGFHPCCYPGVGILPVDSLTAMSQEGIVGILKYYRISNSGNFSSVVKKINCFVIALCAAFTK